jgi:glycerate dehydrogenase
MGVVINAGRLDFDAKLDFTKLKDACGGTLTMHNDSTPTPAQIAERAKGHAVVISKEVPVDVNLLPDTVKLICEAGTGYNNIDLAAAKARGITVCNVAGYSSDAVAHLVLTFVLNFSASIVPQHVALAKGDRSLFTVIAGKNPALRAHRQDHRFSGRHRRHRQQGCDDRQSPRNERPGVVPVGEDRTRQMGSTRGAQRPT